MEQWGMLKERGDGAGLERMVSGDGWKVTVREIERKRISDGTKKLPVPVKGPGRGRVARRPADNDDEDGDVIGDNSGSSGDEYEMGSDIPESVTDEEEEVNEEDEGHDKQIGDDADIDEPRTPSRRKRGRPKSLTTGRKRRELAAPTPRSKARSRMRPKKPLRVAAPSRIAGGMYSLHCILDSILCLLVHFVESYAMLLSSLPADPHLRAQHVLHVAARPDELPCRDAEFARVLRAVEELLEEGSGGCVYISGVPGTGKTATVHAVVRELKRMAEDNVCFHLRLSR
jgi:origin recognition complex subunit 1